MCEKESNDHEVDVKTDRCICYYDTGEGYLVVKVRLEYHRELGRWYPIEHKLLGVSNVEDESVIGEIFREFDMNRKSVKHLPEFSLEHIQN